MRHPVAKTVVGKKAFFSNWGGWGGVQVEGGAGRGGWVGGVQASPLRLQRLLLRLGLTRKPPRKSLSRRFSIPTSPRNFFALFFLNGKPLKD